MSTILDAANTSSKMTLYHATQRGKVMSIFKNGLVPSTNANWGGSLGQSSLGKVYLANSLDMARYYGSIVYKRDDFDGGFLPILRVNVRSSKVTQDPEDKDSYYSKSTINGPFEVWDGAKWRPLTLDIARSIDDGDWDEDRDEELDESNASQALADMRRRYHTSTGREKQVLKKYIDAAEKALSKEKHNERSFGFDLRYDPMMNPEPSDFYDETFAVIRKGRYGPIRLKDDLVVRGSGSETHHDLIVHELSLLGFKDVDSDFVSDMGQKSYVIGRKSGDQVVIWGSLDADAARWIGDLYDDVNVVYQVDPLDEVKEAQEYQTGHTAPDNESGAPLWDVTRNGIYPSDFYGPEGSQYAYGNSMSDYSAVVGFHNKPNRRLIIYRAISADIPKEQRRINEGDWVTLDRTYAIEHGKSNLRKNYKVLQKTVFARDLFTYGDSLAEWGYDPQPKLKDADIYSPEELEKAKGRRQEKRAKAKVERERGLKNWLEKKAPKQRNGMVYLWVVAYGPYDPNKGISVIDQIFVEEEDARKALTRNKVLYSAWFPIEALEYSRVRDTVKQVHGAKINVDKVVQESLDPGDFNEPYDNETIVMEKEGIRYAVDSDEYPSAALAFDGDKKVGFLYTNDEIETPDGVLLNIFNVTVLDEYQRKGVGANLYKVLLKAIKESGKYVGLFSKDADVCNSKIHSIRSRLDFEPYTYEDDDGEDVDGAVAWVVGKSERKSSISDKVMGESKSPFNPAWGWADKPSKRDLKVAMHVGFGGSVTMKDLVVADKGMMTPQQLQEEYGVELDRMGYGLNLPENWEEYEYAREDLNSLLEDNVSHILKSYYLGTLSPVIMVRRPDSEDYQIKGKGDGYHRVNVIGTFGHKIRTYEISLKDGIEWEPTDGGHYGENVDHGTISEARGWRDEWMEEMRSLWKQWAKADEKERIAIDKQIKERESQIQGLEAEVDRKMKAGLDHEVTQEDFINFHKTGFISSDAYTDERTSKYLDEYYSNPDRKKEMKLVKTINTPKGKIEIMERVEKSQYVAHDENDDIKRDRRGRAIYMTDEEIKSAGLLTHQHDYFAYDGDKAVGYATDGFGVPDVKVRESHQKLGIGLALLKMWMSNRKDNQVLGQMTQAGMTLAAAYHKDKVRAALEAGKKVPADVLKDYPDLAKNISESTTSKTSSYSGIVYHYTNDQFDPNELEAPAYFSNDKKFASAWGDRCLKYKVVLNNPDRIHNQGMHFEGFYDPEYVQECKDQGFDGVVITNDGRPDIIIAFDRWQYKHVGENGSKKMAESKDVLEDGWIGPLYHGSKQKGLKKLDPSKAGTGHVEYGVRGSVTWFTDNKDSAIFFTGHEGEEAEARVYKAYVRMDNPMDVDVSDELNGSPALWLDEAKNEGHDGLIVRNTEDPYPSTVYAVWDASQIRLVEPAPKSTTTEAKELAADSFGMIELYHGTTEENAEKMLEKGWEPSASKKPNANMGQARYLYLTNHPENAMWFANQHGGNSVLVVKVPKSELMVDPEDGFADTVDDELNNQHGMPGSVVATKSIPASNFSLYDAEEFEKAFNQISESVNSINGDLERDDVVSVLVKHANKHHAYLYDGQSEEEAVEMGMDPGFGRDAYFDSKEEMENKIDCVFNKLSKLPDPIPVWRVLRLDPDMTYYNPNKGTHWSFDRESALKFAKNEKATHIVSGEVHKHSVNWPKTIERNIVFSCNRRGEVFEEENEIYAPAGKVKSKKIDKIFVQGGSSTLDKLFMNTDREDLYKIRETILSEKLALKPKSSPRQTSEKPLVYLTMEKGMAQAYAAGYVQDAHVTRPSKVDGVIFTIEANDQLREAGGDVWQSYRDDLQEGAKLWVDGEFDEIEAHNFKNFVEETMMGEDVDDMAALASKNPDGLLDYMEPMSWMFYQKKEHGYSELAVKEVPWNNIISIKEYDDGKLTHATKGGSSQDEDSDDVLYHGAPLEHWEPILKKLPGRKVVGGENIEESTRNNNYTIRVKRGSNEDGIMLVAYDGNKPVGNMSAFRLMKDMKKKHEISPDCEKDIEEVKKAVGRNDVGVFFVVGANTNVQNIGIGSSMYAKMIKEVGKRDAILIAGKCSGINDTSDQAVSLWKNSSTIRDVAHVSGLAAAWRGLASKQSSLMEAAYNEAKMSATATIMSSEEMTDWILDNKLQDGWGKIDDINAYEIARKTNTWRLVDIPLSDLDKVSPGSFPKKKGRKDLPIIILKFDEGEYEVLDGKHRVAEARHAGKDTIKAWVADWSIDESREVDTYLKKSTIIEAAVKDVRSKGFNEFLEKYSSRMSKGLKKKDLFVRFAPSAQDKIVPITKAHHDPTAVYAYPLEFVVNNPMDVKYGSNMDWLHVLRIKTGSILELQSLTERDAKDMLAKAGADVDLFNKKRNEFKRRPPRQMFVGRLTNPMGLAFMYAMQHRDAKNPEELLSGPEQRRRFLKTGYQAVRDNSSNKGGSIINTSEPQQIFFLHKDAYEVVDRFHIGSGTNSLKKGSDVDTEHLMGKMVANIAKQLGEKKIVWQKDKPNHWYNTWDTYQAWIGDDYLFLGHKEIDPDFVDDDGMFRSPEHREKGHADMDRFVVKLIGSAGSASVDSSRHSTIDMIADELVKKYKESPDTSKTIDGSRKPDFDNKAKDVEAASIKKLKDKDSERSNRFVNAAAYLGVKVPSKITRHMEDVINKAVNATAVRGEKQPFDDYNIDKTLYDFFSEEEGIDVDYATFSKIAEELYDKVVDFMKKHGRMNSHWSWMADNFAKGKNPFDEKHESTVLQAALIESALVGYTFRIKPTYEDQVMIVAYNGKAKVGHIQAFPIKYEDLKDSCKKDVENARQAIGRENAPIYEIWKSHVFNKEERGENHRGLGVGSAMYAKMIEEIGKRGAIAVAGNCSNYNTTSKDALKLWNNSKTIRDIAHVFGFVAAWKGISERTNTDEKKDEAMRTMRLRWTKTPKHIRSKGEFRQWGTDIAEYNPELIDEFLKEKKDGSESKDLSEYIDADELGDHGVSEDMIEWVESLEPQAEIGWDEKLDSWTISTKKNCQQVSKSVPSSWIEEGGFHALVNCPDGKVFVFVEDWLSGCIPKDMKYGTKKTNEYCRAKGDDMRKHWEKVLGSGWVIHRKLNDPEQRVVRYTWIKKSSSTIIEVAMEEDAKQGGPSIPTASELRKIRSFLQEKKWDKGSSHNQCQRATWFLHRLYGGTIKGGWPKDGPRELNAGYLCKGTTCPDGEWAFHYWLEKDGYIIDITSDQFVGGEDVVITKVGDPRYKAVSTKKDVDHDFRFTKDTVDPWVDEWKESKNLKEGLSISSWASYGKDDLTVRINGSSQQWQWLIDDGRAEIVDDIHAARNIKQALNILNQYAKPKTSPKPPVQKKLDGLRCPECGASVTKDTSKCPSCDEMISESKEQDILDATHRLKDGGLTDRFWQAFNANSLLYHNKSHRLGAGEEEKVAYAGKVSEVLQPEVLRLVDKKAHNVPVYVTYRIDGHAAHGDWKGQEAIFVHPGAKARMLWHLLHEVKHAIDTAKGKKTLIDPDLSTPEKYRAYKKDPSERRAEQFAKSTILKAAASLKEDVNLVKQSRNSGFEANHLGVFGWFNVYGDTSAEDLPTDKIKTHAIEASKRLAKIGFKRQRRIVVVNRMGENGVNYITGIQGDNAGFADAKKHAIWASSKHFDTDILVHEWLHMFYEELPKSQKAKWLNFWNHFVGEGLVDNENAILQALEKELEKIANAKTFSQNKAFLDIVTNKFEHFGEIIPANIHGILRDYNLSEEEREKVAYVAAIGAFGIHPTAVLSKDVVGPLRNSSKKDQGQKGDDVDIIYNGSTWFITDELKRGSVVNARHFAVSNHAADIAELVDAESLRQGMKPYIERNPKIQDFVDELLERTKSPEGYGGVYFALKKSSPQKLEKMIDEMAIHLTDYVTNLAYDDGPGYHEKKLKYKVSKEEIVDEWGKEIERIEAGAGFGTNGILIKVLARHLDLGDHAKELASKSKKNKQGKMNDIGDPVGGKYREKVAGKGFTARAYGAANKDELWATTGEALANGRKINPRLKKAFMAMIDGNDPMRASGFLESSAIIEAAINEATLNEAIEKKEISEKYIQDLRKDLNQLLSNVSKVKTADQIDDYFKAIHRFRDHLELMVGPRAAWSKGLVTSETPLKKLLYDMRKNKDEIENFANFYAESLYDLTSELNKRANWDHDEYKPKSRAEYWWGEQKDKWKTRVQRKARKLWKNLSMAFEGFDLTGKSVKIPLEEVEQIEGHTVIVFGYDPEQKSHPDLMDRFKEGLKKAKKSIRGKLPSLLPPGLPIVLSFDPDLDKGGEYLHGYVGPYKAAISVSAFGGGNPDEVADIITHEAAHHYWYAVLSQEAKDRWQKVYLANMAGRLNLQKVKKYWEEAGTDKTLYNILRTKLMTEDPTLYLQLNYLSNNENRTGFQIWKFDDLKEAIKEKKVWVVPKQPVTWYAGKNAGELFAEAVSVYIGYGQKAMPDYILASLKNIVGDDLKESVSTVMEAALLCEARFDRFTTQVSREFVNKLKKLDGSDRFTIEVDDPRVKGVDFDVDFENKEFRIDGGKYSWGNRNNMIVIWVSLPKHWRFELDKYLPRIKEVIAHEYEHLFDQGGDAGDPEKGQLGHMLNPVEMNAMLAGFMKEAKTRKVPFMIVVDEAIEKAKQEDKEDRQHTASKRRALADKVRKNIMAAARKRFPKMVEETVISETSLGIDPNSYDNMVNQHSINTIKDFRKDPNGYQKWDVVSASRVKKIWSDYAKTGIVRDEKGMADIAVRVLDNITRLYSNSLLTSHALIDPNSVIKALGLKPLSRKEQEAFELSYIPYDACSDFAFRELDDLWYQLVEADTAEEQLLLVDRIFNVTHERGDLSAYFIEGGVKTLDQLQLAGTDDSKAIKETWSPLDMHPEMIVEDLKKSKGSSWSGIVHHGGKPLSKFKKGEYIWFSTSEDVAGTNAIEAWKWYKEKGFGRNPREKYPIETARVTLKNAYILDAKEESYYDIPTPQEMIDTKFTSIPKVDTDLVVDWAKQQGYDGVVIKNVFEGKGSGDVADTIVALDPKQVEVVVQEGTSHDNALPGFEKWFKGSKIVNEDGTPKMVYHGTNADFDKFDLKKTAQGIIWFSEDRDKIVRGESGADAFSKIISAYVKVANPAGWDEYDRLSIDQLIQEGYDGIVLDDDVVVFDPKQIRIVDKSSNNTDLKEQTELPNHLIKLAKKVRREVRKKEGDGGQCGIVSEELAKMIDGASEFYGSLKLKDGSIVDDHAWIILKDKTILDATSDQFGNKWLGDVAIVKPSSKWYKHYNHELS